MEYAIGSSQSEIRQQNAEHGMFVAIKQKDNIFHTYEYYFTICWHVRKYIFFLILLLPDFIFYGNIVKQLNLRGIVQW